MLMSHICHTPHVIPNVTEIYSVQPRAAAVRTTTPTHCLERAWTSPPPITCMQTPPTLTD
eukprot:1392271-Amorphochlora_amoeboformis.AAC.1